MLRIPTSDFLPQITEFPMHPVSTAGGGIKGGGFLMK